jgi:diguanylate cyclase (GGDEF)-like protein
VKYGGRLYGGWLCLGLLLLGWGLVVRAEGPLLLSAGTTRVDLLPYLTALANDAAPLDLAGARAAVRAGAFTVPQQRGADLNYGYRRGEIWIHLPLRTDPDAPADWLLEVGFASLDEVEVFVLGPSGQLRQMRSGDRQPFFRRPAIHHHHVFPLSLAPGADTEVFLRVRSEGSLTVPLTLWRPAALHAHDQLSYGAMALYFGMLLALMLYNLLLGLSLRERVFFEYVAFVACLAVGLGSQSGLAFQFLWPDAPGWADVAFPVGMALAGLFAACFTRSFLETPRLLPGFDLAIRGAIAAFALSAAAPWLLGYQPAAMLTSLSGLAFSLVAVAAGVVGVLRKQAGARYFLAAWSLLLVGVAAMALRNFGWLPTHWLTTHAMQIGSALEMLLLSFALADRIHVVRRNMLETLRRSERILEQRVAERTTALEEANRRLCQSEQELRELALHDSLTGLANRRLLADRYTHAVALAERDGGRVAVLLIDLDGLKAINDGCGHAAGDAILRRVADALRQAVRQTDTVGRIGGDEFVVVARALTDTVEGEVCAERILEIFGRHSVPCGDHHHRLRASIGLAMYPDHGRSLQELLDLADDAMYDAKLDGGNRWCLTPAGAT